MIGHVISPYRPRAFDHCVLPVAELASARARLEALGFQVAADAKHPFGTENACVYFQDGTFLEPLAIDQREKCERTAQRGNVFTARDQAYRFRNGGEGFSAIALATDSADADHKGFRKEGNSAGRKLLFGRTMTDASGNKARATFKLAFAADLRSPDSFLFTCQRVNTPAVDRAALQVHPNGVTGTAEIIASEANPADFQYLLQDVINNRATQAHSFGIEIAGADFTLNVMTPEGLRTHFGVERHVPTRGVRFEGIVFTVADPAALQTLLKENAIVTHEHGHWLVADRTAGQGAFFAFDMRGESR